MKRLKYYILGGILFVLVFGTLSHFVYEWSGNNTFLGLFFPVNESTWEHMKLVFFPMLVYGIFMKQRLQQEYPCILSALPAGILTGSLLIPVIFYTHSGIIGQNFLPADIAVFIISVLLAFLVIYKLTLSCSYFFVSAILWTVVFLFTLCFFIFTYTPPDIGLFINPESNSS